jgi:hypothetical protein
MWTVAGTALAVAAVAALPRVWAAGPAPGGGPVGNPSAGSTSAGATAEPTPSPTGTGSDPVPTGTGEPPVSLTLSPYPVCPSDDLLLPSDDGSVLPDPDAAVQAVQAAAPQIAPGLEFQPVIAQLFAGEPRFEGDPWVAIVFNVGNAAGYGELNLQIRPETGASPAERASRGAMVSGACVDGWRHDFADGSVGLHYPYGPPEQEAEVTHVWYYASGGFTMNIGMFPQAAPPTGSEGGVPSDLPPRGAMPLSIEQVMLVAHEIAGAD